MLQILFTLVVTHVTIVCVTLFLHRGMAHRALDFHPILSHFMRFWLWLTTGMVTKEWVAVHRKHHRFTDAVGDPHSPKVFGFLKVLVGGVWLYRTAAKDGAMIDAYGVGTPSDFIEKHLYAKHPWLGILLLLASNLWLFGWLGIFSWAVIVLWIPFWAAGVVNGVGHWFGYRSFNTNDSSRNISPIGVIIGGEELHNNHHESPGSAKLSSKKWEFDIGWMWIRIFEKLRLLTIKKQ